MGNLSRPQAVSPWAQRKTGSRGPTKKRARGGKGKHRRGGRTRKDYSKEGFRAEIIHFNFPGPASSSLAGGGGSEKKKKEVIGKERGLFASEMKKRLSFPAVQGPASRVYSYLKEGNKFDKANQRGLEGEGGSMGGGEERIIPAMKRKGFYFGGKKKGLYERGGTSISWRNPFTGTRKEENVRVLGGREGNRGPFP